MDPPTRREKIFIPQLLKQPLHIIDEDKEGLRPVLDDSDCPFDRDQGILAASMFANHDTDYSATDDEQEAMVSKRSKTEDEYQPTWKKTRNVPPKIENCSRK